jgi:hypothetical protein
VSVWMLSNLWRRTVKATQHLDLPAVDASVQDGTFPLEASIQSIYVSLCPSTRVAAPQSVTSLDFQQSMSPVGPLLVSLPAASTPSVVLSSEHFRYHALRVP